MAARLPAFVRLPANRGARPRRSNVLFRHGLRCLLARRHRVGEEGTRPRRRPRPPALFAGACMVVLRPRRSARASTSGSAPSMSSPSLTIYLRALQAQSLALAGKRQAALRIHACIRRWMARLRSRGALRAGPGYASNLLYYAALLPPGSTRTNAIAEGQPFDAAADLDIGQSEQVHVQVVVGVRALPGTDFQPHPDGGVSFLISLAGRPAITA